MTYTKSTADGDIYIGGEPYDVLDDVKMLRHVPCGTALAGENAIADHVCPQDELNDDSLTHEDLVILTAFLSERGESAQSVAYAVEKPWKFSAELATAKAVNGHEHATDHRCHPGGLDSDPWLCDGPGDGKTTCSWTFAVPDA